MASPSPVPDAPQTIVFRGKKRKTYRQRPGPDTEDDPSLSTTAATLDPVSDAPNPVATSAAAAIAPDSLAASDDDEEQDDGGALSISEALRLRNSRRSRLGGVTFGADQNTPSAEDDELSLMIREEEKKAMDQSAVIAANRRFAPQTGLSGEVVNKHMEEYIKAELAKRHSVPHAPSTGESSILPADRLNDGGGVSRNEAIISKGEQKHTALTGKLLEVDLGDEVRDRNAALTDRAARKLHGLTVDDDEDNPDRPKKIRLGRDGKPWRPRNRRTSDDIKRDQLVEEVLRENRLDVYETPVEPAEPETLDDDEGAADDRIAEKFRREFLDAMAERRRRRRGANPSNSSSNNNNNNKPGAKKDDEILKGPKLGGSRNSRAAMRDILLKQNKEKGGKK